jgi:transposase
VGVIIGMDPHKHSAMIEVIDEAGRAVAVGRFGTDKAGYAELLAARRRHEDRVGRCTHQPTRGSCGWRLMTTWS